MRLCVAKAHPQFVNTILRICLYWRLLSFFLGFYFLQQFLGVFCLLLSHVLPSSPVMIGVHLSRLVRTFTFDLRYVFYINRHRTDFVDFCACVHITLPSHSALLRGRLLLSHVLRIGRIQYEFVVV
jgi:hypothetical protein